MNNRQERYKGIETMLEPVRLAKKETIHSMMSFGRKHSVLLYPVFLATVVFIFVYNLFLHLLIQLIKMLSILVLIFQVLLLIKLSMRSERYLDCLNAVRLFLIV